MEVKNMHKELEKDKNEVAREKAIEAIKSEIENNRYEEAEELLNILENFPGSSREELYAMSTACESCFERRMAWLEIEGLIRFDGEYYWVTEED